MSVSGSNQGVRFGVATSSNRPATPFDGQVIYETDTDRIAAYDSSAWAYKNDVVVCTSSTRPASPFEGQLIYETDTDLVLAYNGSSWRAVSDTSATNGGILQVVSTTKTDTFSTTSGTFGDITGLTATITPSATTSKILIIADISCGGATSERAQFRLARGGTAIGVGDAASNRTQATKSSVDSLTGDQQQPIGMSFLDSPASTSALTYSVQMRVAGGTHYINRAAADNDATYSARTVSTITAYEVSA